MQRKREHTDEMKIRARQVSILSVAEQMGYTVTKIGRHYSLKEHDSVVFYPDTNSYYRHSSRRGGDVISFVQELGSERGYGYDIYDTIEWLLDLSGEQPQQPQIAKMETNRDKDAEIPFRLPASEQGPYKRAYAYLSKTRGIDPNVIQYFVKNKLMYESEQYHNLVFVGHDKHGIVRFASQRGTNDLLGKPFKCDVPGNDKNYGVNKVNRNSEDLYVFESAIDMMSYMSLTGDYQSNKLALGMVADNPLVQFLKDQPHVKRLHFCLDMDRAGRESTEAYLEKYQEQGYQVDDFSGQYFGKMNELYGVLNIGEDIIFQPGKDFNELLKAVNQVETVFPVRSRIARW